MTSLLSRPKHCHSTSVVESGLRDFHKWIHLSMFISKTRRKKWLIIKTVKISILKFLKWLRSNDNDPYNTFTKIYISVVDEHALLKFKRVRVNQVPFITKELCKYVMIRSKFRNKYLKLPSSGKPFNQ